MPVQPAQGAVPGLGPFPGFGAKLTQPAANGRNLNGNAPLSPQILHIPARKRVAAIPAHRPQEDIGWKSVPYERIAPSYRSLLNLRRQCV